MRIVIVDDNQAILKVLSALLESQGHQVVATLKDGADLETCIRSHVPDLICLDYVLPGRNGLELLIELQSTAPDVDVVLITGSNDAELQGKAADVGACGFLHKPFSQAQIIEEVRQIEEARRIYTKAAFKPPVVDLRAPTPLRKTAVIVDDSSTIRTMLKGILEEIGLTVLHLAANGEEGVVAAKKFAPDLICLDVDMPKMTGLEALPLIRAASPQSKVVMVTGNPSKAFVETAITGGAKGYILKPVRAAQVEVFVKKLLA